uniref:Peptidase_M13 domain-containing protein n=1 Tax=Strongyloides papillosus TaxID=174720 RepID=A0A0N5BYH6_STREA
MENVKIYLRMKLGNVKGNEIGKCQGKILDFGFYALRSLFLRKSINKNEKTMDFEGVKELIFERLKEEFKLLIDEKKVLFTNETTEHFLDKLNSMKFGKNYHDYDISNLELMEKCYKNFAFLTSHSNIHETLTNLEFQKNKSSKNHKLDEFSSCEDKFFYSDEMLSKYVFSNGWYNGETNTIYINSDALNEPSFSRDFPRSLNFGGLGHSIALLMLTPFGSHNYNRTFYIDNKNASKVAEESIKKITNKINCFVNEYGMQKGSITNRYINGSLTLAGNIAENGGLKIAHRTYMKWLQRNNYGDIEVPAFKDFTKEQLFFIGIGRNYCEYKSKDYIENQMKIDDHPPAEIRTNVALSNYKPFSDAFNCPLKSKMNPEGKCE